MPQVQVVHTTEYSYARPVRFTPHRLMLRPRDSHDLRLLDATLGLFPQALATRWAHDVFGNSICYVDWGTASSNRLQIVSTLNLEHFPAAGAAWRGKIDPGAELYPFSYPAEEYADLSRLVERHYPDPHRTLERWAQRFVRRNGPVRTMALLRDMTQAIQQEFRYEARDAEGTNTPGETLASGSGACRDFALLMMEAVRALGFAARFVSGYLYDSALVDGTQPMQGGGATHAWCEVYVPGAGWVEFDPTNGLIAGRNLIRVCVARMPQQAVPISGGFIGGADDMIGMHVDVQVTVHNQAPVRGPPV